MRRFVFLWSSLLIALVGTSYVFTISMFFSWWFVLLTIPCSILIYGLIRSIGFQVKVLTQAQKSNLADVVFRQGWAAFFISTMCALIVERNPYEHCVYAITFGIALFCFSGLCFALKNYLGSFNSL